MCRDFLKDLTPAVACAACWDPGWQARGNTKITHLGLLRGLSDLFQLMFVTHEAVFDANYAVSKTSL